jgi:hypothetical protein
MSTQRAGAVLGALTDITSRAVAVDGTNFLPRPVIALQPAFAVDPVGKAEQGLRGDDTGVSILNSVGHLCRIR